MSPDIPAPVVRTFLICQDVIAAEDDPRLVSIIRVFSTVRGRFETSAGSRLEGLCLFAQLTECRRDVAVEAVIREVGSDTIVRRTGKRLLRTNGDPLSVVQAKLEIKAIVFPRPGTYLFEFWCDGAVVAELPFNMRASK